MNYGEIVTDYRDLAYKIVLGNCLDVMKEIPCNTFDMILCDLPYGVTKNKLDIAIPFEPLWIQYERIIKPNGAIVLFGQDKFTAECMLSNRKLHRYNLIWEKNNPTGFLNAHKMPLRIHEDIMVFYKNLPTYNPQMTEGNPCHKRGRNQINKHPNVNGNYNDYVCVETEGNMKFPNSVIKFDKVPPTKVLHRNQKPVELLEYLIKTYTNENDFVLDNCMGSGSTGVACLNTNRKFYGIEIDKECFNIAFKRLFNAQTSSTT